MIPKDPVILLSYVNTQLRDYYDSLEALCTCRGLKKQELVEKPVSYTHLTLPTIA